VQAEREIIQILRKTYPNHGILAEESGEQPGQDECQWVIDPLDGTTNFLHGIPHFAISIAFRHKNRLEAGLVYDPIRQEMFTASRGEGAQINDRRIRVSNDEHQWRTPCSARAFLSAILGTNPPISTSSTACSASVWKSAGLARPRWIYPTSRRAGWTPSGRWA
jgi:fructose-1,6-bisphosphatase/inositol monophosphatase family enzyme